MQSVFRMEVVPAFSRILHAFLFMTVAAVTLPACSSLVPPATLPPETVDPMASAPAAAFTPLPSSPPSPTSGPRRGGEVRIALAADAVSFHPYLATDPTSELYQANVYASGLWRRDPQTLQPVPNLAEAWTVSADGKQVTFRLRRDLKWSDGIPLTAHDFQWTFEQAVNPANKVPPSEEILELISYKAADDYTLQITLRDAGCSALTLADQIVPLPQHVWQKYSWSDPARNPEINNPTVVSGPFRLQSWNRDVSATMLRNDLFFRGAPLLDSMTYRIIPGEADRFRMIQTGEVDTAVLDPADYAAAKSLPQLRPYEWESSAATLDYVGINVRRPLLQDVQARRALTYVMPRQAIADQVFAGLAKPLASMYPPSSRVYNSEIPRYEYDPDKARAMLKQAGYQWSTQNKLLGKDGRAVQLRMVYNEDNSASAQIALRVQQALSTLGIAVNINGIDSVSFMDSLLKPPYDYDLYVLGLRAPEDPYLLYQIWSEKNTPDLNPGGYINKEIEKLYEQANRPPCDDAAQKVTYQKIQSLVANDVPYFWLTYRTGYALVNERVITNPASPLGVYYRPELWSLRTP